MVAFEVKESRAEEERLMAKKFCNKDGDYQAFDIIQQLELEEDDWNSLKLHRWQEMLKKMNDAKAVKLHTLERIKALNLCGDTADNPMDLESESHTGDGNDREHPMELD